MKSMTQLCLVLLKLVMKGQSENENTIKTEQREGDSLTLQKTLKNNRNFYYELSEWSKLLRKYTNRLSSKSVWSQLYWYFI